MNIFDLDEKALAPDSPENSGSYADLDLPGTVGGNQFSIEQGLVLQTLRGILDPAQRLENESLLDLQTLRGILDPELGINVVDLGLVYELRVTENDIYIKMTMTTPGCPMHGSIIEAVERAIELYFPQKKTVVDLVWEPQWTPERLSEEAKEMLGMG